MPRVPFSDYVNHLKLGWVNLAPLEITPSNHCKSALKVLEAGYWGIPSVYSPYPDVERFVDAGHCSHRPNGNGLMYLEICEMEITTGQR
jgi:hypothetical protein